MKYKKDKEKKSKSKSKKKKGKDEKEGGDEEKTDEEEDENDEEEKNESIDLNGDKKGVDLHFEDKDENNGEKITRKLSPIHRENSEQILQDKNENGEDDLNKAMIESNE